MVPEASACDFAGAQALEAIGKGLGIHWEDIDEDISVEGLLAGRPSGESQSSFKKWLEQRPSRKRTN
jgi:hypothetical protein